MERTYVIPLRKFYRRAPIYKRTKRAVSATRSFLQKHMKQENVKLGRHLNMRLWANGTRNPPHKVEVSAELVKDADGDYVYAELVGVKKEALKPAVAALKAEGIAGKLEDLVGTKDKKPKKEIDPVAEVKDTLLKEDVAAKVVKEAIPPKAVKKEVQEKQGEERLVKRDGKMQHAKME